MPCEGQDHLASSHGASSRSQSLCKWLLCSDSLVRVFYTGELRRPWHQASMQMKPLLEEGRESIDDNTQTLNSRLLRSTNGVMRRHLSCKSKELGFFFVWWFFFLIQWQWLSGLLQIPGGNVCVGVDQAHNCSCLYNSTAIGGFDNTPLLLQLCNLELRGWEQWRELTGFDLPALTRAHSALRPSSTSPQKMQCSLEV